MVYYHTDYIPEQAKSSSIFNSVPLAGGDGGGGDSNLVHYRPELIILRLDVFSAGRGLSDCIPII